MAVLLWIVLLSAGVSFGRAQESFNKLPDIYKRGVELSSHELNNHRSIRNHYFFFKSIHQAEIEAGLDVKYIYHNFYLKATECKRGTENADATTCAFRNDRPLVDCVICYKISAGEINEKPKPYLNCMHRRLLSKETRREREIGCFRVGFGHLTPTPVASTGS